MIVLGASWVETEIWRIGFAVLPLTIEAWEDVLFTEARIPFGLEWDNPELFRLIQDRAYEQVAVITYN